MFKKQIQVLTIVLMAFLSSCVDGDLGPLNRFDDQPDAIVYDWSGVSDSLQNATYNTYLTSGGTYRENNTGNERFHYWWNAHMLDVLVDGYIRTNDESYLPKMKALLQGIRSKNGNTYVNVFNDDMQWLGISALRAYQATGDEEYRTVGRFLWEENKKSWSDVLGGGITWKSDEPLGKNACSNGPAAILACLMYQVDGQQDDLDWAIQIFNWLKNTLVDPQTGLVWDNVELVNNEPVFNRDWIFTYNQGSFIGAATLLYQLTGENTYLQDAIRTANTSSTSSQVTTQGLLRDEGQGDGGLFKGIFVRYYSWLILTEGLSESDRNRYVAFMKFNAETFSSLGLKRPEMIASPNWRQQPGEVIDLATQLSGVMLVETASVLQKEELL
ncbi:hypothetical protein MM239_10275 [Belliella sp. DSM 111904]|uniref:Glycosyl hydrolase family 76 n=1 Tax=Belliella filtrata TaxID=2923435 RepID=A0ABS9V1A5_9BACT|nr:glycoside hydrolase family 76 protein [Belliella filtrata]MCH7409780.1 hypothetical protein [Belliella filtrata]